ncbi:17558_t:CDS:2 [Gigaspora rosea]|nr:17558_t:CDS:2 [Gigaspora rosea]
MNEKHFNKFMDTMIKSASKEEPKAPLKESNLVKIKYFYGTDDKDPFEWFDDFKRASEANNWTEECMEDNEADQSKSFYYLFVEQFASKEHQHR